MIVKYVGLQETPDGGHPIVLVHEPVEGSNLCTCVRFDPARHEMSQEDAAQLGEDFREWRDKLTRNLNSVQIRAIVREVFEAGAQAMAISGGYYDLTSKEHETAINRIQAIILNRYK